MFNMHRNLGTRVFLLIAASEKHLPQPGSNLRPGARQPYALATVQLRWVLFALYTKVLQCSVATTTLAPETQS